MRCSAVVWAPVAVVSAVDGAVVPSPVAVLRRVRWFFVYPTGSAEGAEWVLV